jgi:hypothetical protein
MAPIREAGGIMGSSHGPQNTPPGPQKWWEHLGRLADVLQVLGWIGVPTLLGLLGYLWATDDGNSSAGPAPTASFSVTPSASAQTSRPTPTSVTPSPFSNLSFAFSINETNARGKDKAFACPTEQVHCFGVENTVSNADGEIESGCYLTWRAYAPGSQKVFERGSEDCGQTLWVGDHPMEAGKWRLEVDVELADGTKGSDTYELFLINR